MNRTEQKCTKENYEMSRFCVNKNGIHANPHSVDRCLDIIHVNIKLLLVTERSNIAFEGNIQ